MNYLKHNNLDYVLQLKNKFDKKMGYMNKKNYNVRMINL